MKEEILKCLANHPEGIRLRSIDAETWFGRLEILDILFELQKEGIVYSVCSGDPANMEYYDLWFLTKEA